MTWLQTQFDKILMSSLILFFCGLAWLVTGTVQAFALTSAGGCMGCLLTLVTARRTAGPEPSTPKIPPVA
jgi:hypothetical protein